ncbi:MAG: hypothetical protein ACRDT8_23150, partial [Micromonosporaceae bacterium]
MITTVIAVSNHVPTTSQGSPETSRTMSGGVRDDSPGPAGRPGDRLAGLVGGDWNSVSADRVWRGDGNGGG